jgi:hypothetical protein
MKKIMLSLICVVALFANTHAGYLKFINMTNCTYNFEVWGDISTTGNFYAPSITAFPLTTTDYTNPSTVPGVTVTGSGSLVSGLFKAIKGGTTGATFFLGSTGTVSETLFNSAIPGFYPACNGGNSFTATWTANTSGDVVVLIF